jgi:hypothetical protein
LVVALRISIRSYQDEVAARSPVFVSVQRTVTVEPDSISSGVSTVIAPTCRSAYAVTSCETTFTVASLSLSAVPAVVDSKM